MSTPNYYSQKPAGKNSDFVVRKNPLDDIDWLYDASDAILERTEAIKPKYNKQDDEENNQYGVPEWLSRASENIVDARAENITSNPNLTQGLKDYDARYQKLVEKANS